MTGEFPAQRASNAENISFDDVIINTLIVSLVTSKTVVIIAWDKACDKALAISYITDLVESNMHHKAKSNISKQETIGRPFSTEVWYILD